MRWTVGFKIATGFGLVLMVLVAAGLLAHRGTSQVIDASDERAQAARILTTGDALRLAVRGAGLNLRNYIISGEPAQLQLLRTGLAETQGAGGPLAQLRAMAGGDSQAQRVDRLAELFRQYAEEAGAIAQIRTTGGFAPAVQLLNSEQTRALLAQLGRALDDMDQRQDETLRRSVESAERVGRDALWLVVGSTLAGLVLAALSWLLITRSIAQPLGVLTEAAQRITVGDLSVVIPVDKRSDEIGALTRALERMTASLRAIAATAEQITAGDLRISVQPQSTQDMLSHAFARMGQDLRAQIRDLIESAGVLSVSSSEIVASSTQLAASASQSAAAVSETTTTVEEVRQTAQLATQKARTVLEGANRSVQISESGRKSTQDVEAAMARIRAQMGLIAASMTRLSEQNHAIGQIIATVEDIATQSNLLAVNAAIEAAKAGEHGKGFGVVAQEVKNLAEQSRQATTQVRAILGDIQKATTSAVLATEEGGKAVDAGIRQTEITGQSIQALAASVHEGAQATTQIAASSQQQLVGMDQVADAMESIRQASAQNVASANQLETTARSLDGLSHKLKTMVAHYTV